MARLTLVVAVGLDRDEREHEGQDAEDQRLDEVQDRLEEVERHRDDPDDQRRHHPEGDLAAARRAVAAREAGNQVVVVVSARGHKTDELIDLAKEITDTPPAREMDMLLSTGEQESVALMAMAVQKLGVQSISMTGAKIGIVTDSFHTKARIKKEAQRMEQEDKAKGTVSGAAPRKLAGAAAAAVKRKEERLAAEAKKLAGEVSDDQTKLEASGAADARLPAQTGGRKKGETAKKPAAKKTETAKKEPKVTKSTPSPDQAKRILKGSARSDSQVTADSQFDPSKLKNADGDYKSASAMFKGLLFEGKKSDDAIAKEVDKKFGLGEQKAKDYVKWNRGWFRRQGVKIADPK